MSTKGLIVYTYGGGELLNQVFNSVAAIFSSSSSQYGALVFIAANIGLFYAVLLASSKMSLVPLIKSWLVPTFLTLSVFTITTENVIVHDLLIRKDHKPKAYSIDNVPILLAYTAHFISVISHGMTKMLEKTAHGVYDNTYSWTGHIYAGQSLLNTRHIKILDGTTEENFREFCRECVFRDLGLGKYTKEELEEAPQLLDFLKKNTSKIRHMSYKDPDTKEVEKKTCKASIEAISGKINNQVNSLKGILYGAIGDPYKYLLKQSESPEVLKLVEQQIAIDHIRDHTKGTYESFAARRAEQLQMASQKVMGAMGATSIVALRNYMEAFLYLVFPLVIIVSLAFLGFKTLTSWAQMIAWIGFWPPCYVCADFLLQSIYKFRMESVGLLGKSYTMVMSEGLFHIYDQMESIASSIFLAIPFLSWGLLYLSKGGASSLMHWASSFTHAAQGSAATAAGESITGNYSYQNLALANANYGNVSELQKNTSPLLNTEMTTLNDSFGRQTIGSDGNRWLEQRQSSLIQSMSGSSYDSYAQQSTQRALDSQVKTHSNTHTSALSKASNAIDSCGRTINEIASTNTSGDISSSNQTLHSFQKYDSGLDETAETLNITKEEARNDSMGVGIGFPGFIANLQASYGSGYKQLDSDTMQKRYQHAVSNNENYQELQQATQRKGWAQSDDESVRVAQELTNSHQETQSSLGQLTNSIALQKSFEESRSRNQGQETRTQEKYDTAYINRLYNELEPYEVQDIINNKPPLKQELPEVTNNLDISIPTDAPSDITQEVREEIAKRPQSFTSPANNPRFLEKKHAIEEQQDQIKNNPEVAKLKQATEHLNEIREQKAQKLQEKSKNFFLESIKNDPCVQRTGTAASVITNLFSGHVWTSNPEDQERILNIHNPE